MMSGQSGIPQYLKQFFIKDEPKGLENYGSDRIGLIEQGFLYQMKKCNNMMIKDSLIQKIIDFIEQDHNRVPSVIPTAAYKRLKALAAKIGEDNYWSNDEEGDRRRAAFLAQALCAVISFSSTAEADTKKLIHLPPVTDIFVGRKAEMELIAKQFESGEKLQILAGPSGVGKTQLAIRYSIINITKYDRIEFIDATTVSSLEKSCRNILGKNGAVERRVSQLFKDYFSNTKESWLLIFDNCKYGNAEQYSLLNDFMPIAQNGNILLTTQYKMSFNGVRPIEINCYTMEDAREFLFSKTGKKTDEAADEIINKFGGHPLALEYAASYLSNSNRSYQYYLEAIREKGIARMLENKDANVLFYPNTAEIAFRLSLEEITKHLRSDLERQGVVVCLACWGQMYCREIPRYINIHFIEEMSEPFRQVFSDQMTFDYIVSMLCRYSLIRDNGDTLSMHEITHAMAGKLLSSQQLDKYVEGLFHNDYLLVFEYLDCWEIYSSDTEKTLTAYYPSSDGVITIDGTSYRYFLTGSELFGENRLFISKDTSQAHTFISVQYYNLTPVDDNM